MDENLRSLIPKQAVYRSLYFGWNSQGDVSTCRFAHLGLDSPLLYTAVIVLSGDSEKITYIHIFQFIISC